MNRREARAYALRVLASEVEHHIENGSDWLERPCRDDGIATDPDGVFNEADQVRIREAVLDIADSLRQRAERLLNKPLPSRVRR